MRRIRIVTIAFLIIPIMVALIGIVSVITAVFFQRPHSDHPQPTPASTSVVQPAVTQPSASFPTTPESAAIYIGIAMADASFRPIPDGATPETLIGWQISANRDITVSIKPNICMDFSNTPTDTQVISGNIESRPNGRLRSINQVNILVPSGKQLSFYKKGC